MKYLLLSLCLMSCVAPAYPRLDDADTVFQGTAEMVPPEVVQAAADELQTCLRAAGLDCEVDTDGWSFYYAAQELPDGRFYCPQATGCGPRPPGCERIQDCPCRCHGITDFALREVVISRTGGALKHELIHAGCGIPTHEGPEWACQ